MSWSRERKKTLSSRKHNCIQLMTLKQEYNDIYCLGICKKLPSCYWDIKFLYSSYFVYDMTWMTSLLDHHLSHLVIMIIFHISIAIANHLSFIIFCCYYCCCCWPRLSFRVSFFISLRYSYFMVAFPFIIWNHFFIFLFQANVVKAFKHWHKYKCLCWSSDTRLLINWCQRQSWSIKLNLEFFINL